MFQVMLTPSAGKRLIAKAVAVYEPVIKAAQEATLVIVAGTTNAYIAEEILSAINLQSEFHRDRFFRGICLPPSYKKSETGRLPEAEENKFPGDVVIRNGEWQKGKTIFDIVDDLKKGDVIIKGANSLNSTHRKAGILIGHPGAGTIGEIMKAVAGRRIGLVIPVGLEKRTYDDIDSLACFLNSESSNGPRMFPVTGNIITEIEALKILCNAEARLVAAGGVGGAEGSIWLAVHSDNAENEKDASELLEDIANEPPFFSEQ